MEQISIILSFLTEGVQIFLLVPDDFGTTHVTENHNVITGLKGLTHIRICSDVSLVCFAKVRRSSEEGKGS